MYTCMNIFAFSFDYLFCPLVDCEYATKFREDISSHVRVQHSRSADQMKQKGLTKVAAAVAALSSAVPSRLIVKKQAGSVAPVANMPKLQFNVLQKLPEGCAASSSVTPVPNMPKLQFKLVKNLPDGCVPVSLSSVRGTAPLLALPKSLVMEQVKQMNAKRLRQEEEEAMKGDDPELLKCHICEYEDTRRELRQHYKGRHKMENMKFCETTGCDFRTQNRSDMQEHRRRERGRTQCAICGAFVVHMKNHLLTHDDDIEYNCDNCDRTYRYLMKLR